MSVPLSRLLDIRCPLLVEDSRIFMYLYLDQDKICICVACKYSLSCKVKPKEL